MLINKRSLADEVAAKLREQISLGHYKVGEKLPTEPELMKVFGVGRSSIREAIKLLATSGLLRVQQGLGTFVERATSDVEPMDQRMKRANVADLNEVRQLLEMKIAEKAAANRTDSDITEIQQHLADRKAAADDGLLAECVEADIRFHTAIAQASGNQMLADLYRTAAVHLQKWFLQVHQDTRPFIDTYDLHKQLMEDIIARNAHEAWQTASNIISNHHQ